MPVRLVSPEVSAAQIRDEVKRSGRWFKNVSREAAHVHVRVLADTGALLAFLDRADRWHEPCRIAFAQLRLPVATSTAVLTELFHLVGDDPRETDVAWRFVRSGAVTIQGLQTLRQKSALMLGKPTSQQSSQYQEQI